MQEIKFIAWDKKLNIMCDVAAINFYHGNVVLLARNEEQRKLFTEMNKKALVECYDRLSVSIEEVELMQYTGIKEKNEIEIYEGDIVEANTNIGEIFRDKDRFKIQWRTKRYFLDDYDLNDSLRIRHLDLKIIGNIYQNPELLKGVEQ